MGEESGYTFYIHGSGGLYVLTFIAIAALVVRTLIALIRCEICEPE